LHNNGVGGLWALLWKNLNKLPQFFKHNRLAPQSYHTEHSLLRKLCHLGAKGREGKSVFLDMTNITY